MEERSKRKKGRGGKWKNRRKGEREKKRMQESGGEEEMVNKIKRERQNGRKIKKDTERKGKRR